mmetsp:Transcript_49715/g.78691  ORF Transcript_49715/g.78691 Transcript_49715/m.78691 type:complete len:228 (+) Transcript_49715:258-941(+)
MNRHQLFAGGDLLLLVGLEGGFGVGLSGLLVCERFGVNGTLLCRIVHSLFVLGLSVFLCGLRLSHLFIQITNEQVYHRNDGIAFLGLLSESSSSRWWRWWGILLVQRDLRHNSNARAGNATWRFSRSHSATHVQRDSLLLSKGALWRRIIKLRVIEFVQAILCKIEELFCRCIRSHEFSEVLMFFFSLFCSFCHRLIERNDSFLERLDLVFQRIDGFFFIGYGCLQI